MIWAILSGVVPSSENKINYSSICNSVNLHSIHRNLQTYYQPGLNWIRTPASFCIFFIISPFLPITIPTANRGIGTFKRKKKFEHVNNAKIPTKLTQLKNYTLEW